MGAGKTTVGRKLARILHLDFVDTDQILEQRTGVSISHIFEIEGESGFRDRESRVLEEVSGGPQAVISTGGGIILRPENRKIMRKSGRIVYLRATLEILWHRLKDCQTRPLLQSPEPRKKLAELLTERDPVYTEEADYIVNVSGDSAYKTAQRVRRMISNPQTVAGVARG